MVWEIVLATAVGKALLSVSLRSLFAKMNPGKFLDFFRSKKLKLDLLQKLKLKLFAVNSVLNDAEEQLHVMNLPVKEWLDELKDALYEAEDLFDEIATEALKYDKDSEYKAENNQVKDLNTSFKSIVDRLDLIVEQKDFLSLKEGSREKWLPKLPTTSLLSESEVCFRNHEKEEIIAVLTSSYDHDRRTSVIVIAVDTRFFQAPFR